MNRYQELMQDRYDAYLSGDYVTALEKAYGATMEAETYLEKGHAERDVAAALLRGANFSESGLEDSDPMDWLKRSANSLEIAQQEGLGEATRELAATEGWMGRVILRSSITMELASGTSYVSAIRIAQEHYANSLSLYGSEMNDHVDQYEINDTWPASISYSLSEDTETGLTLAKKAIIIAKQSESKSNPTSGEGLSDVKRVEAKAKALARGIGAYTVAKTADKNRSFAIGVAHKIV